MIPPNPTLKWTTVKVGIFEHHCNQQGFGSQSSPTQAKISSFLVESVEVQRLLTPQVCLDVTATYYFYILYNLRRIIK